MPPTLGQRLKHAREKRGLTLRDIEHTSKIPVARLQDLEDDRLNTFGGMTYAKSFLRSYAALLEVNADEVLSHLQTPPLGGVRDYRYLVESHGPWISERTDHAPQHMAAPHATFAEGKSFLFAALVCVAFALLIGGGVLANAYFGTKNSPSDPGHERGGAAYKADSALQNNAEEYEFSVFGVNFSLVPDQALTSSVDAPLPKAIPVPEGMLAPQAPSPPKAEAVR